MAAGLSLAVVPTMLIAQSPFGKGTKCKPEIANFVLPKDQNRLETKFAILGHRTPRNLASVNNTSKNRRFLEKNSCPGEVTPVTHSFHIGQRDTAPEPSLVAVRHRNRC